MYLIERREKLKKQLLTSMVQVSQHEMEQMQVDEDTTRGNRLLRDTGNMASSSLASIESAPPTQDSDDSTVRVTRSHRQNGSDESTGIVERVHPQNYSVESTSRLTRSHPLNTSSKVATHR